MARDPEHLSRLYGEEPPTEPRLAPPPSSPLFANMALPWILLILTLGATSALVSAASSYVIATGGSESELVRWGVTSRGEWVLAYQDHSPDGDGTSGCAVLGSGFLVRWDDAAPTGRIDLRGGAFEARPDGVEATHGAEHLSCPLPDETAILAFTTQAEPLTLRGATATHPARDRRVDRYRLRR